MVDRAMLVTNNNGEYQYCEGETENEESGEEINEYTELSFKTEFNDIAERNENESSYGKRIVRNVTVKMSEADINGMEINTSDDLMNACNVYDLLGKTADDNIELVLVGENKGLNSFNEFVLTNDAAETMREHPGIKLKLKKADTEEVICKNLVMYTEDDMNLNSVVDLSQNLEEIENLGLVLRGGTWTLDVKNAGLINKYKALTNEGELIVTEGASGNNKENLTLDLKNCGAVEITGEVTMPTAYTQNVGGVAKVGANDKMYLTKTGELNGKLTIEGILAVHGGIVTLRKNAEAEVTGSLLTSGNGTSLNLGTITLIDKGAVIVTENENETEKGTIVLAERNSDAKVNNGDRQGYIKWLNDEDVYSRQLNDAYNCLMLNEDVTLGSLGELKNGEITYGQVKYIEVVGTQVRMSPKNEGDMFYLKEMIVDEGASGRVPLDMKMQAEKTVNHGILEVYGSYSAGEVSGTGTIYYNSGQVNVATSDALRYAMENVEINAVVLESDVEVSEDLKIERDLTVDLNGKTLKRTGEGDSEQDQAIALRVTKGEVTVKGNGMIDGGSGNRYNMAVRIDGGKLNIISGTFTVGDDKDGGANTVVYAANNSEVNIIEGRFEHYGENEKKAKFLVNIKDSDREKARINVKGGTFKNFNPAVYYAEGERTNFLAEGYYVKVTRTDGESAEGDEKKAWETTWNVERIYEVCEE